MRLITPLQMKNIDRTAIEKFKIPGIILMQNAALKITGHAIELLKNSGSAVVIVAGGGNNGGDAIACAWHLYHKGFDVRLFLCKDKNSYKGDAKEFLNIVENIGLYIRELGTENQIEELKMILSNCGLVIDGIFGTGLNREITGIFRDIIEVINNSKKTVLSIDIPSGINGENGKIMGSCIKADMTVTFAFPKTGLIVHPGCDYTGKLYIEDIGIPDDIIREQKIDTWLLDDAYIRKILPRRLEDSNKGTFGKVLIVTGSNGMTGAGCLTSMASLRAGAGLVYCAYPASLSGIYEVSLTEPVKIPIPDNGTGFFDLSGAKLLLDNIKDKNAAAIGPGLSTNESSVRLCREFIENCNVPMIIDADALNAVATDISILKRLKTAAILTPHPGEMARLLGISIAEVQNNRIKAACDLAQEYHVTLVLKGARTIIAYPEGGFSVNPTGNSGMATAGSGDVLTGIISAFLAQGLSPEKAADAGVFVHGKAGDMAAEVFGKHGLIAGDLIKYTALAVKELIENDCERNNEGNNLYC